ncbi:YihY/virulence factor BrkB family protein [Achromobacter xylosoxidans]|uniref:YihY/virulence factor BrkB family protein n=1 Tax=Alcaligenes xylosoxydans xylosoxydans TaxID=85698 RepID=UPI001F130D02|nr:YihY/virulence factor BrkB family protein [Achromobacter xylosoxidans]
MRLPNSLRVLRPSEIGGLLMDSANQWSTHRASSKGAALALYMVFSLAPMLILVIAVAGAFFGEDAVRSELFSSLRDLTGERGAEVIQTVLASAHESGGGWIAALISIFVLIFSATTAFAELKASLDDLWEVSGNQKGGIQGMVRSRVLSFGLVLVLALFLLISLTVNAALGAARKYYGDLWAASAVATVADWLSSLFSFSVVVALFAVIFKLLPSARISWRDVIPGAIVTAALFLVGKWGIGVYLSRGAAVSAYGAAGSLIALLLWIYYSAQIFFFGAVFTRQFALRSGREANGKDATAASAPTSAAGPPPSDAP